MKKILFFLFIALTSSCSVYFNTFYNAEKFFEEANTAKLRDNGKPSREAIKKYNQVIKKCGKIITNNKDSKYVDDSVFMIGKCNYYKKRGYSKAIEKFEELLKFYPDSPFVNEAHLYLAKSLYESNKEDEAKELLKQIIENVEQKEIHPEALKLLSEFSAEEEDIYRQKLYLKQIIHSYEKSDIYNEAFFDLAKINFDSDNFQDSYNEFYELSKKKISKQTKLHCLYYLAYNQLKLNNLEDAKTRIKKLMKKEISEGNVTRDKILHARIIQELGNSKDAIDMFDDIIEKNKRTKYAAESAYYLAELYFLDLKEYDLAIENYNKVKTNFSKSEFVEKAVSKSAIVSQIIQYQNPKDFTASEDMVDEQFKLAEYYLEILNAPDSANVVYDKILLQKGSFIDLKKSIQDTLSKSAIIDSLKLESLIFRLNEQNRAKSDSTKTFSDSLFASLTDSINFINSQKAHLDSLKNKVINLDEIVILYDKTIIPHTYFLKIWLSKNVYQDSVKVDSLYQKILEFPNSKYFYAADDLINDREIQFTSLEEREFKQKYDEIVSKSISDSTIVELQKIADSDNQKWVNKANFAIGEIYLKTYRDSTNAKIYYDKVIAAEDMDLIVSINNVYQDGKFKFVDQLQFFVDEALAIEREKEKEEKRQEREATEAAKEIEDSKNQESDKEEKDDKPALILPQKSSEFIDKEKQSNPESN